MFGRRGTSDSDTSGETPEPKENAQKEAPSASENVSEQKPESEPSQAKSDASKSEEKPAQEASKHAEANKLVTETKTEPKKQEGKKSAADLVLANQDEEEDEKPSDKKNSDDSDEMTKNKEKIYELLMEQIDINTSSRLPRDELKRQIIELIGEIVMEQKLMLSQAEQQKLANDIVDDMLGFGPLEVLLRDDDISDIMVNGAYQVYIEKGGSLQLSDVKFRDNDHVMAIATRIVTGVGRRVDESSPICDARLPDGSRVNVIAPPCAIKGAAISIRKFSEKKITLDTMVGWKSISEPLCRVLKICGAIRLNIIISGGTGSGKTTMLNAMSRMISQGERVVTIEDAAELQLQQPHVVPLETRHANLEGDGEITMRDLVKNALRMRPDRIILGEVRGGEAFDMLQAMNTGHDGSMGTLHANNPREALGRLENMVGMAVTTLPSKALRTQITSAVNLIIQVQRMRDGGRRCTHVTEVVGMEGDVIITQDLFLYEFEGEDENGKLKGKFKSTGIRPNFTHQAAYFGLDQALIEAMSMASED